MKTSWLLILMAALGTFSLGCGGDDAGGGGGAATPPAEDTGGGDAAPEGGEAPAE